MSGMLSRIMNSAIGEGQRPHPCRLFSLKEIRSATKNFDRERVIGKGRFGTVYRGQISGEGAGHVVAIKRLDSRSSKGKSEFLAEISKLSTLRHSHLVSLIGYCNDKKETILVYEYIPNGSLYDHLHGEHTPLSWVTRLKIAIGAARGMDYLHIYGVIHHDVKSKYILLDPNWVAMISDFGLSNLSLTNQSNSVVNTLVKGTVGYLDPGYVVAGQLTKKSDVYAFGVVLFELLSGRPAVDLDKDEDQCMLVVWAQKYVKDTKFDKLVDPRIKRKISTKCLNWFAKMAARCVHNVPNERPTMSDLVASLQDLLELQEKSNCDVESSGIPGFHWKILKYVVRVIKRHSGQSGTSSQKNLDHNKKQQDE
ncbi:putative serine/threonine-protein kinase PBL22 [Bidens hawaiensis]|uniref:putative serine/threonine-protein kinase PBL22 n=1 Tax=Bidens hawaiensis TaxID=980011 RepID=UPI00404A14D7